MRASKRCFVAAIAIFCLVGAASSALAGNVTPYYIFDGDHSTGYEIQNGVLVNTFSTFRLGYPPAITDTIWLGQRDNGGASQYTLGGVTTGNTSAGGAFISEILDGTTNGAGTNYGVTCCASQKVVTVANFDWSNQHTLFDIAVEGAGIAYDSQNGDLFVSTLRSGGVINEYDLAGDLLNSFTVGLEIAGLAYEQATNTLWGYSAFPSSSGFNLNLYQFSTAGAQLEHDVVSGFFNNPLGGEMPMVPVPEPATLALLGLGLAGLAASRRRKQ